MEWFVSHHKWYLKSLKFGKYFPFQLNIQQNSFQQVAVFLSRILFSHFEVSWFIWMASCSLRLSLILLILLLIKFLTDSSYWCNLSSFQSSTVHSSQILICVVVSFVLTAVPRVKENVNFGILEYSSLWSVLDALVDGNNASFTFWWYK